MTSGGHDVGLLAVTDTYICNSCKEIVDVSVGLYGKTYLKEEISSVKRGDEFMDDMDFYLCPSCNSDSDLIKWNIKTKPCPKCTGKMKKDSDGEMLLWD